MRSNLLIVDDEVELLEILKQTLETCAENIFIAENGVEALAILKSTPIDCVVSDINMPVMDGIELIKMVRQENNPVPFIFFTGNGNERYMEDAARYGAFDFIDKPYFKDLREVVKKGLRAQPGYKQDSTDSKLRQIKGLLRSIN